ncbi:MAG: hypothetical protein IPI77_16880 [Saprospiraceae bacterium]|nr:hypothetical protein [Saprospiraceae bacterium]
MGYTFRLERFEGTTLVSMLKPQFISEWSHKPTTAGRSKITRSGPAKDSVENSKEIFTGQGIGHRT